MSKKTKKEKLAKYDKMLNKYLKKRDCVKIYRTVRDGEADIYGIISGISDTFLQISENHEFKFNGEVIIRQDHYESISCSKYEKIIKKILLAENELSENKPIKTKLDLSSWDSIFTDLKKQDIHVIIECEDLKEYTFTIGAIVGLTKKSVEVHNYDASGKLDKKSTIVKYKDITIVRFNDRYSTTFRKYLKQSKSSSKKSS
ncbi:hypothetical protein N9L92_01910 [Saprospiraceae bacterium]|nr:hypothetical protein [Saprospiraceae bacterium]